MIMTDEHFDLNKADRKWNPIWDMLEIESDNMRNIMTKYCEYRSKTDPIYQDTIRPPDLSFPIPNFNLDIIIKEHFDNPLPLSIKILNKIESENILISSNNNFRIDDVGYEIETMEFKLKLSKVDCTIDNIDIYLRLMTDEISNDINEKMEDDDILVIHNLLTNVKLSDEHLMGCTQYLIIKNKINEEYKY